MQSPVPLVGMAAMAVLPILLCLLLAPLASAAGLYAEHGPVLELNEDSFVKEVQDKEDVWMVAFYMTDNCKNCELMVPEYSKAAEMLSGMVKVGALDCTSNVKFCIKAGVRTSPAVKVFPWRRVKNPYTGAFYKEAPREYQGPMQAKAVYSFAAESLPAEFVRLVSSTNGTAESFLKESFALPKVLLFSKKEDVAPLYKGLSLRFRNRLQFGQASAKDEALAAQFGVDKFPTVLVLQQGKSDNRTVYDGPLKALPLAAFLEGFAAAAPEEDQTGEASLETSREQQRSLHIERLNAITWKTKVLQSEDLWMVAFALDEGGSCSGHLESFYNATAPAVGTARFGQVNMSESEANTKLAEQYGVKHLKEGADCLKIVMLPFGTDKTDSDPEIYEGPFTAADISAAVMRALPALATPLTSLRALEQFVGTGPATPKLLLVSAKKELPDIWRALAARFHKHIAFGQVHDSLESAKEKLKVARVPSVLLVANLPGKDGAEFAVQPYGGPLKLPYLMAFCQQIVGQLEPLREQRGPVEVPELSSNTDFEDHCVRKGSLCVIGLLEGSNTEELEAQVQTLEEEASKRQGQPFAFSWVDFSKRPGFGAKLGVRKMEVPTVVVLSPRKMRFAMLGGGNGLSAKGVAQLMDGVLSGRVATAVLQALPSLEDAAPPSDGEEAQAEEVIIEEEFSLADILSENIEESSGVASKAERLLTVEKELEVEAQLKAEKEKEAAEAGAAAKKKKKRKKKRSAPKSEL